MVLHAVWTCLISVWKYQTDKIGVLRDFQRYIISVCKDNCDYRMFLSNHASKVLDPIFLEVKCFQNTMFM